MKKPNEKSSDDIAFEEAERDMNTAYVKATQSLITANAPEEAYDGLGKEYDKDKNELMKRFGRSSTRDGSRKL